MKKTITGTKIKVKTITMVAVAIAVLGVGGIMAAGFINNIITASYSCTGTVPTNATLCSGDSTGLVANTPRVVVSNCNSIQKCEYVCKSGYRLVSGVCKLASSYSCTGSYEESNADLCSGDSIGLAADTRASLVSSCTASKKCEWVCKSGYRLVSGVCKANATPTPVITCTETDGGNKPFIAGGVSFSPVTGGQTSPAYDTCSGKIITEYYCKSDKTLGIDIKDCSIFKAGGTCYAGKCQ